MKKSTGSKVALAAKLVCASIGVLPASLLVLAQIDVCTVMPSNAQNHSRFFRDILASNPDFGNAKISNIGMLGSHDCMADGIGMFTGENPHQTDDITLYNWANFLGRGAMVRLSRAQDANVYEQLNAGVRYIDARITKINGVYYNSHTLLADKFENNLKLILKWLDENPGEFIVIYIYNFFWDDNEKSPYYETKEQAWENLYNFFKEVKYNNKCFFDYDRTVNRKAGEGNYKISNLSYNDVTESGTKAGAVIFYCDDTTPDEAEQDKWYLRHLHFNKYIKEEEPKELEDPTELLHAIHRVNGSAGTMNSGKFKDHILARVNQAKSKTNLVNYVRYLQTQTTPNEKDIMPTATSWSLIEKARKHNRYVLDLFSEDEWVNEIFPYMPVYLCDNVTCNDNGFNSDVINLLTKYNNSLK